MKIDSHLTDPSQRGIRRGEVFANMRRAFRDGDQPSLVSDARANARQVALELTSSVATMQLEFGQQREWSARVSEHEVDATDGVTGLVGQPPFRTTDEPVGNSQHRRCAGRGTDQDLG